jgi:ectoine hydroxylase-related dioxygenase (phytanoyl-CoA dioxygenase family)
MISDSQIQFYRDKGYLLVESLIDRATIDELNAVTGDLLEQSRKVTASDGRFDIGPGHTPAHPMVRRIKHPETQHPAYDRLMRSPAILDIVEALIGPGVRFHHGKLNFKPNARGRAVEWHQDCAFYPHTNDDILAVGVLLEDCATENGPLKVVPGSHKGPVFDHHHDGLFVGAMDPGAPDFDAGGAVDLTGPAGSVTFHHVRTVHGSAENLSARPRPILLFSYLAVDAWPIVEKYDLADFNARILRGDATRQPRQERLPIRIPLPPVPGADSIFENQEAVAGRSFEAPAADHHTEEAIPS